MWQKDANGTWIYVNPNTGRPAQPPQGSTPPDGGPINPQSQVASGSGGPNPNALPESTPVPITGNEINPATGEKATQEGGMWVDQYGRVHYPYLDTSNYSTIGGAFEMQAPDILRGMDETAARDQALIANATNQGQTNLANAANATNAAGQQILNNSYAQAAEQASQGAVGLNQAAQLADYNTALGEQAMGGLSALGNQATQASAAYGAQGNDLLAQQQALQGTGIGNLLQMQGNNAGDVAALYGFAGQGPAASAAEQQLRQATDQNMSNAIALARSGRGAGDIAANMRQAQFQNAATQQQSAMQMAQLRAQEEQAWRQQQLQAISQAGQLGLQGGTAAQQAWQNYINQAGQAASGAGQLGATYAGLGKDLTVAGINAQQGYQGLANSALGTGYGYNSNMTNAANAATGTGVNFYNSALTQGNQLTSGGVNLGVQGAQQQGAYDQANTANKNNLMTSQLSSDTSRYGANKGVAIANQAANAQKEAAIVGGVGALIGGAAGLAAGGPGGAAAGAALGSQVSDYRAKTDIRPLAERMAVINKYKKAA